MSLKEILNKNSKFSIEDLDYIINKTNNQKDYMLLNYIEQKLIESQGKEFVQKSASKIQYIMSLILKKDINELYEFYDFCLSDYLNKCKNNKQVIPGFNITFITFIHMSFKILRKIK